LTLLRSAKTYAEPKIIKSLKKKKISWREAIVRIKSKKIIPYLHYFMFFFKEPNTSHLFAPAKKCAKNWQAAEKHDCQTAPGEERACGTLLAILFLFSSKKKTGYVLGNDPLLP